VKIINSNGWFNDSTLGGFFTQEHMASRRKVIEENILLKERVSELEKEVENREIVKSELKKVEEAYSTLVRTFPDAVAATDLKGRITYLSEQTLKLHGLTDPDELLGKSAFDLLDPKEHERALQNTKKTIKDGIIKNVEYAMVRSDGSTFTGELNASLIRDENGEPSGFLTTVRDMTKRKEVQEALAQNEEKYRNLFQYSNDAILIHDFQGKIIDVNIKTLELLGYSEKEILELKIADLHTPAVLEKSRSAFDEINVDTFINMEIDFKKKNGEIITADVSSSHIEIGNETLIQEIVRDITGRKMAAKKLEQLEVKFRFLAEYSPNMIFINYKGKIDFVNEKCVEIMGYAREEFYDPDFNSLTLIAPESSDQVISNFQLQMKGIDVEPFEYKIKTKDGGFLDAIISSKLIPYRGEHAILGIVTDISRLKDTEESLRVSEERFRKIFESTKEGIIICDRQGEIVSANPGAATLLGYGNLDELIGMSDIELYEEPELRLELVKELIEKGTLQDIELLLKKKDGNLIYVLSSASNHTDKNGEVIRHQIVFMDITERKKAEEDMKRRLMKFRLDEGNLYLVMESIPTLSLEALKDLINVGYHGIVLSRGHREELQAYIQDEFDYYWLAERDAKFGMKPSIQIINSLFDNIGRRHAVFIDRLDYLISKNGFKKTLDFIHHLRELIYLKGSIVILSIDPFTIQKEDLRLIEKECKEVEPLHKKIISDNLFNILKYTYRQNALGLKPSYSAVGKELNISKPTVRKRVSELISTGYLREEIKGRNKAVELTERGRQLFWK